jgi:hypothetical protein
LTTLLLLVADLVVVLVPMLTVPLVVGVVVDLELEMDLVLLLECHIRLQWALVEVILARILFLVL